MTVGELRTILEEHDEDLDVCVALLQHRTNLAYDISDVTEDDHPDNDEDEQQNAVWFTLCKQRYGVPKGLGY